MLNAVQVARRSRPPLPRWGVVATLAVALVALGQLALAAGDTPPRLGLRAAVDGDRLVLAWVAPAGLAWDAGLRPGDVVLALDDRAVTPGDAAAAATAWRVEARTAHGATAVATTRAAGEVASRRQGAFILLAAWFALVGGVAFALARDAAATSLLVGMMGAAAALLAALATPYGAGWALAVVFVALTVFGAGFLLLFLRFPIDHAHTRPGRIATTACLATHATLLLAYGWAVMVAPTVYEWLRPLWEIALLGDLLGACVLALAAWWVAPQDRKATRGTLALVALGLVAGTLPFGSLILLPSLLSLPRPVSPEVAALGLGFLPIGLALALLSRRLLGITHLVRRSLVAAVVWLGLLGLVVLAFDVSQRWLTSRQAPLAALLGSTLVVGALFAGVFPPAQTLLRRVVERRIFPDYYEPVTTLRQFGAALVGLPSGDPDTLAREILARLAVTLDLAWCALTLHESGADSHTWTRGEAPAGIASVALLPAATWAEASALRAGDRATIVPLVIDGARVGGLALGPKRHNVELLPEDAAFVAALAPLVATTLQSALRARQLAAQVAELAERERTLVALSAQLLRAHEEERRRIALEIHDDPLQRITLLTRLLERADGGAILLAARPALDEIGGALRAICIGLRPPVLDDLGLVAGLVWLAEDTPGTRRGRSSDPWCMPTHPRSLGPSTRRWRQRSSGSPRRR